MIDEPEVLNGMRSFAAAQTLLAGAIDPSRPAVNAVVGWYGSEVDENEGYFAMVAAGGAYEDLVGDVLRVSYRDESIYVYCIGGATLPNDLCLSRQAFLRLELLNQEEINVNVRVVV